MPAVVPTPTHPPHYARRLRPSRWVVLLVSSAVSVARAQDSARLIQPIPRVERPTLAVGDFQFTATPDKSDLEDLNSVGGALFALRGGDPTATERETEANLGQAAASLLVEHLIASGNFRVLERTNLDQVKTEQQLVASTAAQQGQTVAQQAKLIGAKYVISGQITKFGRSKKKKGGGFLGVVTKSIAGVGIESHQTEYDVGLTARIVDATTGEVVASFTTDGTAVGDAGRTIAGLGG